MNKNKKRTASGLILAGTSLAAIAGRAATNASAKDNIFGSIKNFFTKSKNKGEGTKVEDSLKLQKEKIIKLLEKSKLAREGPVMDDDYIMHRRDLAKITLAGFISYIASGIAPVVGYALTTNVLVSGGLFFLPLIGFLYYLDYVLGHNTFFKKAEEARNNLNGRIKEDMLNKQYTLKEFENIVTNDEECSEFIRQLLVLERDPESEPNDESHKLLDNGELEDAKKVLKKLFLEINSVDKINNLKNLSSQEKEKFLKVVKPLVGWSSGIMPSISGEGDRFCEQKDKEFFEKILLLKNALDDNYVTYRKRIDRDEFIDFICCNKDVEGKTYTKEMVKDTFIVGILFKLERIGVNTKSVNVNRLLDLAKILFGDLKVDNTEKLDEEKNKDSKEPLIDSVVKKYYSKFKSLENPAEMGITVLDAIETWIKETVTSDNASLYNRNNQQESFQNRISAVRSQLKNVDLFNKNMSK